MKSGSYDTKVAPLSVKEFDDGIVLNVDGMGGLLIKSLDLDRVRKSLVQLEEAEALIQTMTTKLEEATVAKLKAEERLAALAVPFQSAEEHVAETKRRILDRLAYSARACRAVNSVDKAELLEKLINSIEHGDY